MEDELFRYRCGFYANVSSLRCICWEIISIFSSLYSHKPSLCVVPKHVELLTKRWRSYLMVLPVLNRIHWGMGLFCFWALASFCFVRKVLWLCNSRVSSASKFIIAPLLHLALVPIFHPQGHRIYQIEK
jgi:hypothetical protein